LLVERVHVERVDVCLDGLTRLLVDVPGESVSLLGRPDLLVTRLPSVVFGKWCGRARSLEIVRLQIPLVDAPATPRRDVGVVGLDSVLLEVLVADEVVSIFAEARLE
jgi:hypothetical protein